MRKYLLHVLIILGFSFLSLLINGCGDDGGRSSHYCGNYASDDCDCDDDDCDDDDCDDDDCYDDYCDDACDDCY